jgi:hypothetical protein
MSINSPSYIRRLKKHEVAQTAMDTISFLYLRTWQKGSTAPQRIGVFAQ